MRGSSRTSWKQVQTGKHFVDSKRRIQGVFLCKSMEEFNGIKRSERQGDGKAGG